MLFSRGYIWKTNVEIIFFQSGGPYWAVPKGRKDGRISIASETRQLPGPNFNISQLQQSFSQRGLSLDDLVALSGIIYELISRIITELIIKLSNYFFLTFFFF